MRVQKVADRLGVQTTEQKRAISKLKAQGKKAMEMNGRLNHTNDELLQAKRSLEEEVKEQAREFAKRKRTRV